MSFCSIYIALILFILHSKNARIPCKIKVFCKSGMSKIPPGFRNQNDIFDFKTPLNHRLFFKY